MKRRGIRENSLRVRLAAAAARIMAEDGIDDFALAKRKAARQLGIADGRGLPGNDEVEAALDAYRALYQADEHPARIQALRSIALDAMHGLAEFHPYLTGPVLRGSAGRHAEIELQLFPESTKEVELFLLNRGIEYTVSEARRYAGDRAHAATVLTLHWQDVPLRLTVLDPRDERLALKTSIAGRVIERASATEVASLVVASDPDREPFESGRDA